ncbi:MAG: DUF2971 domain-containing protein [Acidimicrobiales bacterium]
MDSVYHYTTASGLLGILSSASLWATDLRFLNDAQEAVYAQDLVIDAVRSMENPVNDPAHWAHQHGQSAVETFSTYQELVLDELEGSEFGVYVVCFCESGDLLSQWRGYGQDNGYAIEFRRGGLEEAIQGIRTYPPATGLFKVQYGRDAAEGVVRSAVDQGASFNLNHPGVKAHYSALAVSSMLAQVKHPGFAEEQEWRLVVGLEISDESSMPVSKQTLYRVTPMAIVPYIDVPFNREAIGTIRVGPGDNVEVREAGVRRLIRTFGLNATVTRSDVPLRP